MKVLVVTVLLVAWALIYSGPTAVLCLGVGSLATILLRKRRTI